MWARLPKTKHYRSLHSFSSPASRQYGSDTTSSLRSHDPLRILFCGADEFSIYSLRALHELRKRSNIIKSIDVVCRPDKPVGRGLNRTRSVPIKSAARELDLPLHQIDTFTSWSPPSPTNLIIAVSFGLLVPPRILSAAPYGGLNVHPSLLPNLRGPAPIHWALLQGLRYTGVTLQTLHPDRFDAGHIVDQTPEPGISIPDGEKGTYADLMPVLAKVGADMLVANLESGKFLQANAAPPPGSPERAAGDVPSSLFHAPKITPEHRRLDSTWWAGGAEKVLRRDRVIGPLWDNETVDTLRHIASEGAVEKMHARATYYGWRVIEPSRPLQPAHEATDGPAACLRLHDGQSRLCFKTGDGALLSPDEITIAGRKRLKNEEVIQRLVPILVAT